MTPNHHRLRLVLLVIVLIIPSVFVTVVGWKNVTEEAGHLARDARGKAREITTRATWKYLESIKRQVEGGGDVDASVRFVGWLRDGKLTMAWERDPDAEPFRLATEEGAFAAKVDEAESALDERDLDRALNIYHELFRTAGDERQRVYVQRKLAQALRQSGTGENKIAADKIYRDLLSLPSSLVDGHGVAVASVAALALAGTAGQEVLERVARELESPSAMTRDQAFRWRNVVDDAQKSQANLPLRNGFTLARDRLSARIAGLDHLQDDLNQDPDFVELRKDPAGLTVSATTWRPYGRNLLISRTSDTARLRPQIVAVARDRVFARIQEAGDADLPFTLSIDGESGEALDEERLPGVRFVPAAPPEGLDLWHSFYMPFILVVLGINLLGGYLLWRDTRREMRIAELRTQFVSSVSHELKTPLTAIRMFGEILQCGGPVDSQTRGECVDTIVNESERLTRLLNNVLDFSGIEHGQKTYRLEPTRLPDIVAAAAKMLRYPLAAQGFHLRMDIDDDVPLALADGDAIKQAVLNLLTNAMKYSGESRDICLRLVSENGDALIELTDRGIGIPKGEQSRIFEKFYRAPVQENDSISGTGLGLALVAHIVHGHGGSVRVESTPGAGSTFSIRVPLVRPAEEVRAAS